METLLPSATRVAVICIENTNARKQVSNKDTKLLNKSETMEVHKTLTNQPNLNKSIVRLYQSRKRMENNVS